MTQHVDRVRLTKPESAPEPRKSVTGIDGITWYHHVAKGPAAMQSRGLRRLKAGRQSKRLILQPTTISFWYRNSDGSDKLPHVEIRKNAVGQHSALLHGVADAATA
jgi:hypothetical protein